MTIDTLKNWNLTVKVRFSKKFMARWKIAKWLIQLAGAILNCNINFNVKTLEEEKMSWQEHEEQSERPDPWG